MSNVVDRRTRTTAIWHRPIARSGLHARILALSHLASFTAEHSDHVRTAGLDRSGRRRVSKRRELADSLHRAASCCRFPPVPPSHQLVLSILIGQFSDLRHPAELRDGAGHGTRMSPVMANSGRALLVTLYNHAMERPDWITRTGCVHGASCHHGLRPHKLLSPGSGIHGGPPLTHGA